MTVFGQVRKCCVCTATARRPTSAPPKRWASRSPTTTARTRWCGCPDRAPAPNVTRKEHHAVQTVGTIGPTFLHTCRPARSRSRHRGTQGHPRSWVPPSSSIQLVIPNDFIINTHRCVFFCYARLYGQNLFLL